MTHTYGDTPLPIDDEMLSAYLDGNLPPHDEEAVRRAIGTDRTLRDRYHELAATVALLRALPSPAPSRSFTLTADQARTVRETLHTPAPIPIPVQTPFAAAAPAPAPNVTPLRPAARVNRLTPLLGAFGAIAAVLLFVLITADFATGGFRRSPTATRPTGAQIEQTTPPAAPAASTMSASAAIASAPATAAAATLALPTPAPASPRAPSPTATTGIPLALVRVVEVALAMIAVAGLAGAIGSARVRRQHSASGT